MYEEFFGNQGAFPDENGFNTYGDFCEGEELTDRWQEFTASHRMVDYDFVKQRIPNLPWNAHKGTQGKVLVIAGSRGMSGAAFLSAGAALKTGAGLVRLCVPDEIIDTLQILIPEATCIDRKQVCQMAERDEVTFREWLMEYQAIIIGPGLSKAEMEAEMIFSVIRLYSGTIIIDADALNLISRTVWSAEGKSALETIKNAPGQVIFTPHRKEMKRLLNVEFEEMPERERTEMAEEYAQFAQMVSKKFGVITLMKHADTVVTAFDKSTFNTSGNSGMATGGSGDVLTGVIAGLAAQGMFSAEAARCGAYIHGRAGDLAAENLSMRGMTAKDILTYLPLAMREFE